MARRLYGEPTTDLLFEEVSIDKPKLKFIKPTRLYGRQSTPQQKGNDSYVVQMTGLPRFANKLGYEDSQIRDTIADIGRTGRIGDLNDNEGMSHLMEEIENGEIESLIVANISRLFRPGVRLRVVTDFVDACKEHDVAVVTMIPMRIYSFCLDDDISSFVYAALEANQGNKAHIQYMYESKLSGIEQGKWRGVTMSPGFMTDVRKQLANGADNPDYHGLKPVTEFHPVMTAYFEIAHKHLGSYRKTADQIYHFGPAYPDFDKLQRSLPNGNKLILPPRLLSDRATESSLRSILTDVRYIGHFTFKNRIVKFNSHEPLIDEELFFAVFNMLSPVTIDGRPNPAYCPRTVQQRPKRDSTRKGERPRYEGFLSGSDVGEPIAVRSRFITSANRWNYVLGEGNGSLSRRADTIDALIDMDLEKRLRSSFDSTVAFEAVSASLLKLESTKASLNEEIGPLEDKIEYWDSKLDSLSARRRRHAEAAISEHEEQIRRIESTIGDITSQIARKTIIAQRIHENPEVILNYFTRTSSEKRRGIAHLHVKHVELDRPTPFQELSMKIVWHNGTTLKRGIPKGHGGWSIRDTEILRRMVHERASQISIASEFPTRKWSRIREKTTQLLSGKTYQVSPKPIQDDETYNDYLRRQQDEQTLHKARSGERWLDNDIEKLKRLVDADVPAFDIYREFPYRTRNSIRARITDIYGQDKAIQEPHVLKRYQSYNELMEERSKLSQVS